MLTRALAAAATAMVIGLAPARAETGLMVLYSAPDVWGNIHQEIAKAFNAGHPDIKLTFI